MIDSYVEYIDSSIFVLAVGDGASPEVFTPYATINKNRSFDRTAQVAAQVVADKTDPTKPGKTVRKVQATDWSLTGDGTLDVADADMFETWFGTGAVKNVKVTVGSVTGALIFTGPAVLESYNVTGAGIGEHVQASLKISAADAGTASTHA